MDIIGGFLGAGKTTLLNYLLANLKDSGTDVLVREYGAVSINDQILNIGAENIHFFHGVSLHEDPQIVLYEYLQKLYVEERRMPFNRLVMEASSLDSPERLMQLFFLGHMRHQYLLGSYITVVDAESGMRNLNEYRAAAEQIAYADVIVLNKIDLVDEETIGRLEKRIQILNPMAKTFRAQYGRVELSGVLNLGLYDQLKELKQTGTVSSMDRIQATVLTEIRPMNKQKTNKWITDLFKNNGTKILRSKGFFCFEDDDYRYEFQAVRKTFHSKADRIWKDGDERKNIVALIGEKLPDRLELQNSFSACV
ncbi:GTP-binding protein [Clostridium sp. KNHs216]|uniref:CobW family GTP-binding protein n=1 Tax=Clostridium sp. KNHs216 TaxID=1550235 RepID=UPI0016398F85|nr:GTP-binding protein [Clostridium sp. KNHs216]